MQIDRFRLQHAFGFLRARACRRRRRLRRGERARVVAVYQTKLRAVRHLRAHARREARGRRLTLLSRAFHSESLMRVSFDVWRLEVRMLCVCYACAMRVLCVCYACDMRVLCV